MTKYKILLLDDEIQSDRERRSIFEAFLENKWFDYIKFKTQQDTMPPSDEDIKKILGAYCENDYIFDVTYWDGLSTNGMKNLLAEEKFDAIFLDVILDQSPAKTNIHAVLGNIQRYIRNGLIPPLFIYSASLDEKHIKEVNEAFYDVLEDRTPNRYYTYSDFVDLCEGARKMTNGRHNFDDLVAARKIIFKIISSSRGEVSFAPLSESELSILHISDLQFGDPQTSDSLNGLLNSISSKASQVDILMITGDVAMHGWKSEFDEAKKSLSLLRDKLWGTDISEQEKELRTIIVPGNHDFDLNTTLMEYCNVNQCKATTDSKSERRIDFDDACEQISKHKKGERSDYSQFGLQAFRKFAYEMTHDVNYLLCEDLNFEVARFLNWGIGFYCLNSVGHIFADETNKVFLEQHSDLYSIRKETLSVILCHHTPMCSEKDIEQKDLEPFRKTMLGYISGNNCKLVFGGHRHINDSLECSTEHSNNYAVFEAASLRVKPYKDHLRGFRKYVLKKENEKFVSVQPTTFCISEKDTSIICTQDEPWNIPEYLMP